MARQGYLGEFEFRIMLSLMRLGDEAYGVPNWHEIEQCSGREAALGSLYAALERLEEKGQVTSRLGDPTSERGGRAKRDFKITAEGLQRVRETQKSLMSLWRGLPQLEGETACANVNRRPGRCGCSIVWDSHAETHRW